MRIIITGGHMSPALSVIDSLVATYNNIEIIFVGRKYTDTKRKDVSLEYHEVTKRKISFIHLETGRLTWIASWRTLRQLFLVGKGFLQSWKILKMQKPDRVLVFGGYIALPIAHAAWLQGVSVYMHEQTIQPGLANKLIAKIARTIFVSFPETKPLFPRSNVVISGNPIRHSVYKNKDKLQGKNKQPVVYITGGSLGSHSINNHIEQVLDRLLEKYYVIHQTGDVAEYDDFTKLSAIRSRLTSELQEKYMLKKHILSDEIGSIYARADIVVGRSGANTFFELIALQKPSVLIPLPWSSHGEQEKHAKILQKAGVSEIFYQTDTSENLLLSIERVLARKNNMKKSFDRLRDTYIHHAEEIIARTVLESK